jgi:tripartite-type tricarboxylate transporter receptor subunit TctC
MSELVAFAKSKPGTLNWATYGNFSQLTLAWVQNSTGASFLQVPFKTSDQTLNSLLAGEPHVLQINPGFVVRLVRAGKLRALAVGSSKRSAILPEVPSFAEVGLDLDLPLWIGMFAPASTPRPIVQRLNTEIGKVLADAKFVERILTPLGAEPVGGSPEQFVTFLKKNRELSETLVKLAKLQPQ